MFSSLAAPAKAMAGCSARSWTSGGAPSGLAVFEARRLADGPVWEGILPYPLPLGLHGTFAPA